MANSRYVFNVDGQVDIYKILENLQENLDYILGKLGNNDKNYLDEKAKLKSGLKTLNANMFMVKNDFCNKKSMLDSSMDSYRLCDTAVRYTLKNEISVSTPEEKNFVNEEAWNKWSIRQIKSWKKYIVQVEESLEYLYDDEYISGILCSKYFDGLNDDANLRLRNRPPINVYFVDGFIMEGKTTFLLDTCKYDTEAHEFWRKPMIDGNALPYDKYQIFIWYSIFKHYFHVLSLDQKDNEPNTLYIDRLGSNLIFRMIKSLGSITLGHFLAECKYYNTVWSNFIGIATKQLSSTFNVDYFKCNKCPWPIYDVRKYEQEIYPTKEVLSNSYLNFYFYLDKYYASFPIISFGIFNSLKKRHSDEIDVDIKDEINFAKKFSKN